MKEEDSKMGLEHGLDQCGERRRHSRRGEGREMGLGGAVREVNNDVLDV